uniref:Ion_trans_N domain-containing protein n=1 Tax=Mesocestoides corti TaxID=53468 RepID=A0A5K3FZB2_MESCO
MTRQPASLSCSNHSTPKSDLMAQDKPHTTQRRLLSKQISDESERRGGEDRRSSVAPPQVIQKIDLNGILPSLRSHSPSAASSGTSSPKSSVKAQTKLAARTRKSIPKQTSADKKWEDGEVEEAWERTLTREVPDRPQVIQKIDLNGVLPSLVPRLSSRDGSLSLQSSPKTQAKMHRVTSKSLETQHEETKHLTANSTSTNESTPGSHKPNANQTNEVTYKHKVMIVNTDSKPIGQNTRGVTRHPVVAEKRLGSRMSELQIATDKTSSKAFHVGSESLFERASKWLEATNSAFDRKFRPASATTTTTLSTSNSFHRARNAFINKNTLAERKMVFTRVKNGGDLEQAIPGFRWRVIPGTTTAAYERKANEAS